jgi:hypothetical protein
MKEEIQEGRVEYRRKIIGSVAWGRVGVTCVTTSIKLAAI